MKLMSVASLCQVVSKSPGVKKKSNSVCLPLSSWSQSPQPKLARLLLHTTLLFQTLTVPSRSRSVSRHSYRRFNTMSKSRAAYKSPPYANILVVSLLEFEQPHRNCAGKFLCHSQSRSNVNACSSRGLLYST